jgi:hypothetical protein
MVEEVEQAFEEAMLRSGLVLNRHTVEVVEPSLQEAVPPTDLSLV